MHYFFKERKYSFSSISAPFSFPFPSFPSSSLPTLVFILLLHMHEPILGKMTRLKLPNPGDAVRKWGPLYTVGGSGNSDHHIREQLGSDH